MDAIFLLLGQLGYWAWFILAIVLVVVEVIAPGAVFLWLAIAAGVVGGVVFFEPDLDWKWQLTAFAVLSILSILLSRRYLRKNPLHSEHPTLNRRAESHIGREFVLKEAIADGHGRVVVGDGSWRVEGPDTPAGKRIKVVAVDGTTLKVEVID